MKKLFAVLLVFCVLLLPSCSNSTQISSSSSASRSMMESLSGTYVGDGGSALTLFPDGTSEYYYALYQSTGVNKNAGNWIYKDGTLTWTYHDTPVTAAINEQSALSFTLEQAEGWNREKFTKISDSSENRTIEQYRKFLRDTLGRPEMNNFDSELNITRTFSDIEISMPFYWIKDSESSDSEVNYIAEENLTEECFSNMTVRSYNKNFSSEQFNQQALDLWKKCINTGSSGSYEILIEPSLTTVGNLNLVKGKVRIPLNDSYATIFLAIINNPHSSFLAIMEVETDNTIFSYSSDFEKMLNSIRASDTPTNSSTGRSSTASASSNGVTPELKSFLDSYEAFMDQYIAFMQQYENSNDTFAMLSDYLDMLQQYSDFTEKLGQYDTSKMSAADSSYYLEVTTRVTKKLYSAAIQ